MKYKVVYSCVTHTGKCRRTNQDNYICDGSYAEGASAVVSAPLTGCSGSDQLPVFGVFDGMGGEECGDVAALLAAEEASRITVGDRPERDFMEYCRKANAGICGYADRHGIQSMGTTAALLAFTEKEIAICNIGDSRIFRLSGGQMEQLSEDHLSIAAYGRKPPLSQNLGIPPTEMLIEPYVAREEYREGDIYLLCTDGLTDMLTVQQIARILQISTFAEAADRLLEEAMACGGKDNITMILCRTVREEETGAQRMRRGFREIFNRKNYASMRG